MKKITRLSIFAVALMTLASSCNKDEAGLNPPEPTQVTISASSADAKTVLDGSLVKWESGDEIALVFPHPTAAYHVETFATDVQGSSSTANFKGTLPVEVIGGDGGYTDNAYAVYPASAVSSDGSVRFTLPAEQTVRSAGGIASGLNLTSASVSLADIRNDGNASASFHNALSILRFPLDGDVTSVTLTGSAPLAGMAPFVMSQDGRLAIDPLASWASSDKKTSVTLRPADGAECFNDGEYVNLLVLPGTHSEMTVKLTTKSLGDFTKTSSQNFTFSASKYYTLNFDLDIEPLVEELLTDIEDFDAGISDIEDQLSQLETNAEKIAALVNQIQSVALVTEYLDNAVYAPYAQQMYNKLTVGIKLRYVVRPAKAMRLLLDICEEEDNLSDVLSAKVSDRKGNFYTIGVTEASLEGDVLTVVATPPATVDKNHWMDSFYGGTSEAALALQISDGNTEILSDFANLVPKKGAVLNITRTDDVPVLKGASLSMSFTYAAADLSTCKVTLSSTGFSSTPTVSASGGNGQIHANFGANDDLSGKSITLTLTADDETDTKTITFAEGGNFEVETSGVVDYIGGEVSVNVVSSDYTSVTSELRNAGDWIYQTYSGSNNTLTVNVNEGQARSAEVVFTIRSTGNITYTKSVSVSQKAAGSAIDESRYHQTKGSLELQAATAGYTPLNIVIIGDGYQKKDLLKGGKFERSARSAMEAFFGVEPYKSFRNRFRVMMVAYESVDEGLSLQNGTQKNTYFKSYYQGSGNTYVNLSGGDYTSVSNVVRNDLGWSDDATYYRTIVIMLINTSEGIGSNAAVYRAAYSNTSTLGEPYASFALAMVTANNTETSNLIRHEAGGHAFGRLGDEYPSKTWGSDVNDMHDIGWYRNITVDQSLWNWNDFIGLPGYEDVTYYQPNSTYWCPINHTQYNSIMYNNTNKFNAPSRKFIYERIIRQTEGYNAYSWTKFLEYDRKNLN